jgi:dimethylamine corrinoid protein
VRDIDVSQLFSKLSDEVVEYNHEAVINLVKELIERKVDPLQIIDEGLLPGIEIVKDKFEKLEYFLAELIFASEAVKDSINLLISTLPENEKNNLINGKVVIGTPKGDIHDVGKNIFATLLMASGFVVYDIGIDNHIDNFINKAKEVDADLIAMSCLMTTSMIQSKELLEDLVRLNLRDRFKVVLGGGAIQDTYAKTVGADGYSVDATGGVNIAKQLMEKNLRQ